MSSLKDHPSVVILKKYKSIDLTGAANDDFFVNALKTLFRLSRVLLRL